MSGTSVGLALRQAREQHGLLLRDIAARTKISLHVLDALERDALDEIPGGLFTRSYLRAYAGAVGLNPEALVGESIVTSNPDIVDQLRARFHVVPRERKNSVQLAVLIASAVWLLYLLLRVSAPAVPGDAHHDEQWLHPAGVSLLRSSIGGGHASLDESVPLPLPALRP